MTPGLGGLFIGNVGLDTYEEIDFADSAGLNFGWPLSEGPTDAPGMLGPLHGFAHGDPAFVEQDPQGTLIQLQTIVVGVFYSGDQYGGALGSSLLYNHFYAGWVRALQVNSAVQILKDWHVAHFPGITAMKVGQDGYVYAVSLFASTKILKLNLLP